MSIVRTIARPLVSPLGNPLRGSSLPWEDGGGTTPSWTPLSFGSRLMAYYANSSSTDGDVGTSIADLGPNARTLTCSGTASAQPEGFPRGWHLNGKPYYRIRAAASQYAQDQGAASFWNRMHRFLGCTVVWKGALTDANTGIALLGNWGGATSNQNSFRIDWTASTEILTFGVTSKVGGGTQHISSSTTANALHVGDVVLILWVMRSDNTWEYRITREARYPGDTDTTITVTGTKAGGTPDSADPDFGLTFGARGGLASGFTSMDMAECFVLNEALDLDGAEATSLRTYMSNRYDFSFLSFDADTALAYSTDYADTTHWDDSGHDIVGDVMWALQEDAATDLGWTTGTKKIGVIGDSRYLGTGASAVGTTDCRAILAANASGATYTHSGVGPVDDGSANAASKNHFARSGYVTRSVGATLGHSQRSSHSVSIDAYVGSAKSYNDTHLWHDCIGINDLNRAIGERETWDFVDEWVRMVVYRYDTQIAQASVTPGFCLVNEPVTGVTTTGALQRLIRCRNRAYHSAVAYLRSLGYVVKFGNINDTTYHP